MASGTDAQLKDESKKLKYPIHQKAEDLWQIE